MIRVHTLVVGGGPAGATAARFLASRGLETLLVERDLSYRKPCGGGIPSYALQELSIPPHVVRRTVRKIRVVPPRGEDLIITFPEGARIEEGAFQHLEQQGRETVSVIRKRSNGETFTVRSDYVVASDGISHSTGSVLDVRRPPGIYTLSTRIAHTPLVTLPEQDGGAGIGDACEFWFGARHASNLYSWIFPSAETSSLGTGSPDPGELGLFFERFLRRRFGAFLPEVQATALDRSRKLFRIPRWEGATFNRGNVLFAGDAAATVMPVTYEGIYYAMKSGELAATAIAEQNPGLYRDLWNERFRKRFTVMRMIKAHFFRSEENIEKWVALHRRPDVQELAIRLWLRKEHGNAGLRSYLAVFRHVLGM